MQFEIDSVFQIEKKFSGEIISISRDFNLHFRMAVTEMQMKKQVSTVEIVISKDSWRHE
jgi:hypothetical protein